MASPTSSTTGLSLHSLRQVRINTDVLTSSSSFAPRDSLSKLSLSSRLVVSSRQAKVSKLPLVFWLNEIVHQYAL